MAAITGDFDFWNISSDHVVLKIWLSVENGKTTISATVAALATILCPIIVLGNLLVILSIWKDPLKKLRSSPSNFIILSMAIADLLVGLVECPHTAYWGWVAFDNSEPEYGSLEFFSFLINVSLGHVFLLSSDRFIALVTPLQYRVKVTNKRVGIATVICWIYFLLFGCVVVLRQSQYAIIAAIHDLQIFFILVCILIINFVTLYRFRKYSQNTKELRNNSTANHRLMLQRERTLCKAIAIVIFAFLICFVPWFVTQILIFVCIPCNHNLSLLMLVNAVTTALIYVTSALNPFLYAWRLLQYRDTFKHLLKKRKCFSGTLNRQVPVHSI